MSAAINNTCSALAHPSTTSSDARIDPRIGTEVAAGVSVENASWSVPKSGEVVLHPISFHLKARSQSRSCWSQWRRQIYSSQTAISIPCSLHWSGENRRRGYLVTIGPQCRLQDRRCSARAPDRFFRDRSRNRVSWAHTSSQWVRRIGQR